MEMSVISHANLSDAQQRDGAQKALKLNPPEVAANRKF